MLISTVTGLFMMLNLVGGPWVVIDDGVMGGRSAGQVDVDQGILHFSGTLSLENNGGFSSIRSLIGQAPKNTLGVRMTVRGDGRRYQLRLRHNQRFDGVSWQASFDSSAQWQKIEIPFTEFKPVFRGYNVAQAGPVVAENIGQLGFLLGDKRPGEFSLEVRDLTFYTH